MIATAHQEIRDQQEDALAYLPRRGVVEYRRHQIIYDEQHPVGGLSLIVEGRVKITTTIEDGTQTVIAILRAGDFFGEMALLGSHTTHSEQATALERSVLMSWPAAEVEAQIERQPKLGVALMQILVRRCLDLQERLQSLALDKTPERVAKGLIQFARLGTRLPDGAVSIPPLTHQVFSEYIGTSREIVTFQMNQFRRQGLLRYSRKAIQIYPEALAEHLSQRE
jgi:CRP-like cAMP-binding protein